jgi:hypothetical protein
MTPSGKAHKTGVEPAKAIIVLTHADFQRIDYKGCTTHMATTSESSKDVRVNKFLADHHAEINRRAQELATAEYPAWAPQVLLVTLVDLRERGSNGNREQLRRASLEVLQRLLREPAMETVWTRLRDTPLAAGVDTTWLDIDIASAVWFGALLPYIDYTVKNSRPATEKLKKMNRLARKIQNLVDDLKDDPMAWPMSDRAIQAFADQHLREFCGAHEIDPLNVIELVQPFFSTSYSFGDGTTIVADGHQAMVHLTHQDCSLLKRGGEETDGRRQWILMSELDRFAYYTNLLSTMSLPQVLQQLAASIEEEAQRAPEIKHSGGVNAGAVPFLSRELSGFMMRRYDTPLDHVVGILVGVVLGLDQALTRDQVRGYRKAPRGKRDTKVVRLHSRGK